MFREEGSWLRVSHVVEGGGRGDGGSGRVKKAGVEVVVALEEARERGVRKKS